MYARRFPPNSPGLAVDHGALGVERTLDSGWSVLNAREATVVVHCVRHAERLRLRGAARAITRAGNGWLYPIVAAMLLTTSIRNPVRCIAAAAFSLGIAFTIYPVLKRRFARVRPCDFDPRLSGSSRPLDRYSFPSGHAMTATAFGLPVMMATSLPVATAVATGCLLVSWSRLALGHHYLSDIIGGALLGAAIATCVTALMM